MDARRKVIFALIGAAMLLNISYGLINNGFPLPVESFLEDIVNDNTREDIVSIPDLKEGGTFRSYYNMSVDVSMETDDGEENGGYRIDGITTRNMRDSEGLKEIDGLYSLTYQINESESVSITGSMLRTRETHLSESGIVESEDLRTTLSIQGPKGLGSSSDIGSTINGGPSLRSDMIWRRIIMDIDLINSTSSGVVRMDIDLQEAGFMINDAVLEWSVEDIRSDIDGKRATIKARSDSWSRGTISMTITFVDGCSWPESMHLSVNGMMDTGEGPASIMMEIDENLLEWSNGEGKIIPFSYYDPLGPEYDQETDIPVSIVPSEGGDTLFRGTPQEALSTARSDGEFLNSLSDKYGWDTLTFIDASYAKNDEVDTIWIWNITVAAPPSNGISEAVRFSVGVEGGGILDLKRFTLLSEEVTSVIRYPDPRREVITLSEGEDELESSVYKDSFFRNDEYSSGYKLDMVSRGDTCSNIQSIVFMNILGIDRAEISDLHISRAVDRVDPARMYLVVIDGTDGSIVSETELEGAGITLLNAYGFDLA